MIKHRKLPCINQGVKLLLKHAQAAKLYVFIVVAAMTAWMLFSHGHAHAQKKDQNPLWERRLLIDHVSLLTGIPWYQLAAIDQYERTLNIARPKHRQKTTERMDILYSVTEWVGPFNPDADDTDMTSISYFGGAGRDGDGDGKADRHNDVDVLYTRALQMLQHGTEEDDFARGLWEFYQNDRSVKRVQQFARIYKYFGTLALQKHAFPLPLRSDYSYRSTWGARRSYGGYRIHEGTDIFAGYGVPVRNTSYGIVEVMGWNRYGGWRVGIRDIDNIYHYYAHLSGFSKDIQVGQVVEPGQVIGWVGSSGYGKPGTQGKFPPHLHYGMYRDSGLVEWSFDPYPLLRKWEREEYQRRKK